MDFNLSPEEEAFRQEVRDFLAENLPPVHERGTDFLQDWKDRDEDGYLRVDDACETSVPGVYAVGDVRRHRFHQVAAAVGDAAIAGMDALRYLKKGEDGA